MKKILFAVIAVAVIAVVLHDAGSWFNARSRLNESTVQITAEASNSMRTVTRDVAAQAMVEAANKRGIRVTQYGQDPNGLQIWTEADVHGTWVLGPYLALVKGTPFDQALATPMVVKDYQQAQFR